MIKNKNKIRWNQIIIDPTLDFNKRLKVQLLNTKFGKQFQKSVILKVSKKKKRKKTCSIPKSKLFVKNPREEKKQCSPKKSLII